MKLKFDKSGKFRIVQITDLHLGSYPFNERDEKALKGLEDRLDQLHADLLVFTGDIIYSLDEHGANNPRESFTQLIDWMNQFEVPIAITFGNHDTEDKVTRSDLRDIFDSKAQNKIEKNHSFIVEDRESYVIEVVKSDSEEVDRALFVIDSGDYPSDEDQEFSSYAWVFPDQVKWFNNTASFYRQGDDVKRHVVFQHIPIPEYWQASQNIVDGEFHEDFAMNLNWMDSEGKKNELNQIKYGVCSPELNSGLFLEIVRDRETWGMFVGHDHDNSFNGIHKGIHLVYGQSSGYNSYGSEPKGVTVIDLVEGGSVESFKSYYE